MQSSLFRLKENAMQKQKQTGVVVYNQSKKIPLYQKFAAATGATLLAVNAHATETGIDLSGLTAQFTSLGTAVKGVIAVAMTVAILVVGWRWIKRAVFSL